MCGDHWQCHSPCSAPWLATWLVARHHQQRLLPDRAGDAGLGLAAKNAILIVEYAVLKHHEGLSTAAAAAEAARLRFRPILMTSLAFILGVLPLAISSGAGAGARQSVGTGVMGGMLAATFLAIFFIPFFFKLIVDRSWREKRSASEIRNEAAHARELALNAVEVPHHVPRATGSQGEAHV